MARTAFSKARQQVCCGRKCALAEKARVKRLRRRLEREFLAKGEFEGAVLQRLRLDNWNVS